MIRATTADSIQQKQTEINSINTAIIREREKQLEAKDNIIGEMQKQIERSGSPWYDHFWIGAAVGVVSITGLVFLTR